MKRFLLISGLILLGIIFVFEIGVTQAKEKPKKKLRYYFHEPSILYSSNNYLADGYKCPPYDTLVEIESLDKILNE